MMKEEGFSEALEWLSAKLRGVVSQKIVNLLLSSSDVSHLKQLIKITD
jgi:hypothetical protein